MNKFKKVILSVVTAISVSMVGLITAGAAVSVKKGIKNATSEIETQFEGIIPTIFGIVTILALAFTIAKAIQAFMSYRRQEQINAMPIVLGIIATIVSALASAWSFFSAFGL